MRWWRRRVQMLAVLCAAVAGAAGAEDRTLPELRWRLLGPFRGGWSTVAVGVPEAPDTYYFGAAGGGVWKTTDSGRTWRPVSDGQPITAVGALAVAPSNPSILYVGTGHPEPRHDIAAGNGVYRSDDAGRSWRHLGLADTRHIGALLVDRRDPERVLVAALGHVFGPHPRRGVFRTQDGGKTWEHTLFVDEATGAVDLAADPADPEVVYASTWTARVWPWLSYFTPVQGPGSAVHRSRDGGRTWTRLGGEGWPAGPLGRIGLAVTHLASGATRLYAVVDAGEHGGLYRSDDGGARWERVNDAGWVTSWYMARLTVSPTDPDLLYTAGQSLHVSRDGGRTFTILRGSPGGDDFHGLWVNPRDPRRMVAASDQGTVVTVNGGETWSDWYNQPTGQFYFVATDDRFPWWAYSGQQDSGTVGIASRGDLGVLGPREWHPVGGEERGADLPDPDQPGVVFGAGLGGRISRYSAATGEAVDVSPWPLSGYGRRPTDFTHHHGWFTPLAFSPGRPRALYTGSQVLFRSLDRGATWKVVSPDLSGKVAGATGCGGDPTPEQALACGFGVVSVIAPAARDGEVWVGTDDGRLWLTRNGGARWRLVTPPGVAPWARVASIDLVAGRPGLAYLAVDAHRLDDPRPHVFRTQDFGATWTALGAGLPREHFVSVVRADPARPGLLYAGTELGVQVSLDDGAHWQGLVASLPPAWVHDLQVKDRDLVVATVGRGLWVLDDVSPLRALPPSPPRTAWLSPPAPAHRLRASQGRDTPLPPETPLGTNPPTGAVLDYWLPEAAKGPVVLEVRDARGALVRRLSSAPAGEEVEAERYFEAGWLRPAPAPSAAAGAHRFVWDLRLPRPRAVRFEYFIGSTWAEGATLLPAGMLVPPGEYRLALLVDGERREAPLTVRPDPRAPVAAAELEAGLALARALAVELERAWRGHAEVVAVREAVEARRTAAGQGPLAARLAAFRAALQPLLDGRGEVAPSFAGASDLLAGLAVDVELADRAPTAAQRAAAAALRARLDEAWTRWQGLRSGELPALDAALRQAGLGGLEVPDAAHLKGGEPPESRDLP